jgi:5-amino-6-(5-phosphoribosylamino)uracil reductase
VSDRPYAVVSCAVSVDGCLDDCSPRRLILSGPQDLDEVDELRASVDAILVGAGTIRADNPRLLVRSPARVAARVARGLTEQPLRVTMTRSGALDASARFFTGPGESLVCQGDDLSLEAVLLSLAERSVASVLIEGGSAILASALARGLADELRLAVAPFFVGEPRAPRFGVPGSYPYTQESPMRLVAARQVGGVAVLDYRLTNRTRPF